MGNQPLKNHEIKKENYTEAGFQGLWKLHEAAKIEEKLLKNTINTAFVFKKRVLKHKNIPQTVKDEFSAFLKKEPQNLAKFKHPFILNITEPLIDHKKCLVFATERVITSVGEAIKKRYFDEKNCGEIELKLHIFEILEGLNFLHNNVKIYHGNICPENLYITNDNQWKISGFNFSNQTEKNSNFKENEPCLKDFPHLVPNLQFSAPEVFDSAKKISFSSDIFALGMTILSILKTFESKEFSDNIPDNIPSNKTQEESLFFCSSITSHQTEITEYIKSLPNKIYFQGLKGNIKFLLLRMLDLDPTKRPLIQDIQSSAWLNDPLVQALNYLNTLSQKDDAQKSSFLKGFQKIVLKFEPKIIKTRILPKILIYLCTDSCSSCVLQMILSIMDPKLPLLKTEFMDLIWPSIKLLIKAKEISAQCLFLLVENMGKFFEFLNNQEVQTNFLPLFLKCYDCGVSRLEEAILRNSDLLVKKVDFSSIKNRVLPKVLKLSNDEKYETRKQAVKCLGLIYSFFDKSSIQEQILPTLEKTLQKGGGEQDILLPILDIYEGLGKVIGSEGITTKIIPQLTSILCDKGHSKEAFIKKWAILQSLLSKVYEEKIQEYENIYQEENKEKQRIDKAISDIEEISKSSMQIQQNKNDPENYNNDFDFLNVFNDKSTKEQPITSLNFNINEDNSVFKQNIKGSHINKQEEIIEEQKNFNLHFETPSKHDDNNLKNLNNLSSKKSNNPFEEMIEDSLSNNFNTQNKQNFAFNFETNIKNSNNFNFVDDFFENTHEKNEKNNLFLSFSDSKFQGKTSQIQQNPANSNEIDLL